MGGGWGEERRDRERKMVVVVGEGHLARGLLKSMWKESDRKG